MKLLFYITKNNDGGAERVFTNLANGFADRGYEVIFVVGFTVGNEYTLNENIRFIDLMCPQKKSYASLAMASLRRARALKIILSRERPDALLSMLPHSILCATIATRFSNVPLITSVRNYPKRNFKNLFTKLCARIMFEFSDGIIFQTQEAMDWFPKHIHKRSAIIPNMVDRKFFCTELADERKDIIGIGRLHRQKNWPLVIRAFSYIASEFPEDLVIYGAGDELEALQKYANALGVAGKVKFVGNVADIEKKMARAKLLVFASDYEGMPNVLLESLSIGLPCITTRFEGGAVEDLIENGVTGIIVPKGDTGSFADAIRAVLSDSSFAGQLSANAKKSSLRFEPQTVFSQWENFVSQTHKRRGK